MPVPTPICLATALYWPTGILNVVTANRRRLASPQRRWKPLKSRYMKVKTRPPITLRQRAYVRLFSRLVEFFSNFIYRYMVVEFGKEAQQVRQADCVNLLCTVYKFTDTVFAAW